MEQISSSFFLVLRVDEELIRCCKICTTRGVNYAKNNTKLLSKKMSRYRLFNLKSFRLVLLLPLAAILAALLIPASKKPTMVKVPPTIAIRDVT